MSCIIYRKNKLKYPYHHTWHSKHSATTTDQPKHLHFRSKIETCIMNLTSYYKNVIWWSKNVWKSTSSIYSDFFFFILKGLVSQNFIDQRYPYYVYHPEKSFYGLKQLRRGITNVHRMLLRSGFVIAIMTLLYLFIVMDMIQRTYYYMVMILSSPDRRTV